MAKLNNIELLTQNGDIVYAPVVEDDIEWVTERKGVPGKLTFKILDDGNIKINEGNAVRFKFNDKNVFFGFVFTKKTDKSKEINITAYDQLRYLKNKDTYVYSNKKANQVVKMIAEDFGLKTGTIIDTSYVIANRVEENVELFDIILNALDITMYNIKELFVLYDDFGKLTLDHIQNMRLNLLIDEETSEDYEYTSSIDSNTYNQIKLTYDNKKTGKREVYIAKDSSHINEWGILQFFDTIDEDTNGKTKVDALLSLYNQKTKKLKIKNVLGDVRVRAGSSVVVRLTLNDVKLENFMLVEKVTHRFSDNSHLMDLELKGGVFNG